MVRFKNRYFLCEIIYPAGRRQVLGIKDWDVYSSVKDAVFATHGDYGLGLLHRALFVKYINPYTHVVLIRGPREGHELLWTALTTIKKIGECDAFLKTLHLGGTIRSCQKFLIKHNRRKLAELLKSTKDPDERAKIQESIVKSTELSTAR